MDWSDLPQSILELVLKHLILPDHIRFGSVCCSWRITQKQSLHPPLSQLPFLLLPIDFYRRNIKFFSLSEKRIYKIPMPSNFTPKLGHCISSSHGWLLLEDRKKYNLFHLFNPFVEKGKNYIQLPKTKIVQYRNCLFFSTPSDPNGILLVMKSSNSFVLYRLNNQCCSWLDSDDYCWERDIVSNIICHEGKLYAMNKDWSLTVVDFLLPHYSIISENLKFAPGNSQPPLLSRWCNEVCALVESCGEILMVKLTHCYNLGLSFDVFRADFTEMEWVKVENLGDRTLFINRTSAVSVCASKTGCERNRIYYAFNGVDRIKGLFTQLDWNDEGRYMEFELERDGLIFYSIPLYVCPNLYFSLPERSGFVDWTFCS